MIKPERPRWHWSSLWGVGGYILLLSQAIYRLTPRALEPIRVGLTQWQWAMWIVFVAFMTYSEGYKGFVRQVAPRVAGRALSLAGSPSWVRRLLAPLFCMSLFGATRRRLIISWCLYSGIIVVVIAVRQLAQPYRGIIDAGVVVGLGLGVAAVLYYFARALAGQPMPVPADIPE